MTNNYNHTIHKLYIWRIVYSCIVFTYIVHIIRHDLSYLTLICCSFSHGWRCSSCMFQDLFGAAQLPSAAVFNPHKRCDGTMLVCCCAANLKSLRLEWILEENSILLRNVYVYDVYHVYSYSVRTPSRPTQQTWLRALCPPDSASLSWTMVKMARRWVQLKTNNTIFVYLHTMYLYYIIIYILYISLHIYNIYI